MKFICKTERAVSYVTLRGCSGNGGIPIFLYQI